MSSAGHILDMVNRARYNENIRKTRGKRYKKVKELYEHEYFHNFAIHLNQKDGLKKEELETIKQKIRKKLVKEKRIALVKVWSISFFIFTLVVIFFIREFF